MIFSKRAAAAAKISTLAALSLAAAATLFTHRAASADPQKHFTFTVPVDFTNLPPSVTRAAAYCYVRGPTGPIGQGSVIQDFNGQLRTDLVIRFDADVGKDPGLATSYECTANFMNPNAGTVPIFYFNPALSTNTFPVIPGKPFRLTTGSQPLPLQK